MLLLGLFVFKDSRLIIIADWTQCDGAGFSARLIGWSACHSLQLAKKIPEETEHTQKTVAIPSRWNSHCHVSPPDLSRVSPCPRPATAGERVQQTPATVDCWICMCGFSSWRVCCRTGNSRPDAHFRLSKVNMESKTCWRFKNVKILQYCCCC